MAGLALEPGVAFGGGDGEECAAYAVAFLWRRALRDQGQLCQLRRAQLAQHGKDRVALLRRHETEQAVQLGEFGAELRAQSPAFAEGLVLCQELRAQALLLIGRQRGETAGGLTDAFALTLWQGPPRGVVAATLALLGVGVAALVLTRSSKRK